jgi:hypothetical protein
MGFAVEQYFPEMYSLDPPRGRPFLVRRNSSFMGVWGHQPPSQDPYDPARLDIPEKV